MVAGNSHGSCYCWSWMFFAIKRNDFPKPDIILYGTHELCCPTGVVESFSQKLERITLQSLGDPKGKTLEGRSAPYRAGGVGEPGSGGAQELHAHLGDTLSASFSPGRGTTDRCCHLSPWATAWHLLPPSHLQGAMFRLACRCPDGALWGLGRWRITSYLNRSAHCPPKASRNWC